MMKKITLLLLLVSVLALTPFNVSADSSPYTTWAMGPEGWLTMTQDAYSPTAEIDLDISSAEELVIMPDGTFYIADTGNGRVVKLVNFEIV